MKCTLLLMYLQSVYSARTHLLSAGSTHPTFSSRLSQDSLTDLTVAEVVDTSLLSRDAMYTWALHVPSARLTWIHTLLRTDTTNFRVSVCLCFPTLLSSCDIQEYGLARAEVVQISVEELAVTLHRKQCSSIPELGA